MSLLVGLVALASAAMVQEESPAAAQPPARPERERLICRSSPETGSIVRRQRRCYTRAQWQRIAEAAQENTRDLTDRGTTRPSGN